MQKKKFFTPLQSYTFSNHIDRHAVFMSTYTTYRNYLSTSVNL